MDFNKNNIDKIEEFADTLGAEGSAEAVRDNKSAKKRRKKTPLFVKLIIAACIVVFICSSTVVIHNYIQRRNNVEMNTELESIFVPTQEQEEVEEELPFNFEEMREINAGFVGWISVPNTSISLPVVKYSDNSFYLNRNFYKKYDRRGTVFMDKHNDPIELDSNTILYGHNCYDGTMFTELEKFQDVEFYKKTPVIEFFTEKDKSKWKIYAVFITNAKASEDNGYVFNYIYPHMDGENFDGFINEVNKRRLYAPDVDITDDDKILILSTCTRKLDLRNYRADTRLVVMARQLRAGESVDVNTDAVTVNPSPKYPQLWYDKNGIKNPYANDEKWYPKEVNR